ncbi:MAG: VOC family protein [Chloroflexi bacterium]|nr:VOC family protein [Chloroflexota bacterium]MBI3732913.1 VOC family protein [Chloroflexota bacterium]
MLNFSENVLKLDHTAICVEKIEDALPLYRDLLGGQYLFSGDQPESGFRMAQFAYPGGSKIEVLEPLGDDSFLHKFLRERGPGVHHMTFRVKRVEELAAHLKAQGYRVVGENYSNPHWKEAFISPVSACGTVIQLAESDMDMVEPPRHSPDLERRLRGQ